MQPPIVTVFPFACAGAGGCRWLKITGGVRRLQAELFAGDGCLRAKDSSGRESRRDEHIQTTV